MYYSCIVKPGNAKTEDQYYHQGEITEKDGKLFITCPSTALSCYELFSADDPNIIQMIPDNIDSLVKLINQLYSNPYNGIYSKSFLRDKNLQPAKGMERRKDIVFGVVNLKKYSFDLLIDPFSDNWGKK